MKQREGQCPYTAILLFLALMGSIITGSAQNLRMVRSFTMNDGLPSNLVYSCVEDDKGFLWVATDNGICRFDGKYFKKYGKQDGVPDNEVLQVVKEKDGTIWISSLKQGPCYYDEKTDRFIDPLKNITLNKDLIRLTLLAKPLEEGNIVFYNIMGNLFFRNKKLDSSQVKAAFRFYDGNELFWLGITWARDNHPKGYAVLWGEKKVFGTRVFESNGKQQLNEAYWLIKKKVYLIKGINDIYIIRKKAGQYSLDVKEKKIDEHPLLVRENGDEVNVSTSKGSIYVFDYATDAFKFKISGNFFANSSFQDKNGNIWVATVDKGLILFRKGDLNILRPFPDPLIRNNFRCVFLKDDGTIYGGNNYGEIVKKTKDSRVWTYTVGSKTNNVRVSALLASQNKIFAISEWGCIVDYNRLIRLEKTGEIIRRVKKAAIYNDSVIIAANISHLGSLYKINTLTEKAARLNVPLMRITSITVVGKMIYLGTMEGLFVYDYEKEKLIQMGQDQLLKNANVLSTAFTPDSILWVSTDNNGILVLKNGRVIHQIKDFQLMNFAPIELLATEKAGVVWTTTRRGLSTIRYEISGNKIKCIIANLNHEEWVSNNVISGIAYKHDSIFLAADIGIVSIPANVTAPQFDIKTYLTEVKVNQKILPVTTSYNLSSSERTITLTFAGVNLSGYFDHFVYSLDDDSTVSEIVGNTLNLRLEPGSHAIRVRAVDINGVISQYTLPLRFNINAPFYRKGWFVFLTTSLFMGAFFFALYQLRIMKQRRMYAQRARIEKERNRITEDLHDDIGSTLSSLKVYSDVAGNLMEKDVPKTKYLLRQISENSSKILEDIGDIIWSMRTDKFNTLSIDSRIKNFVSEVLGSREIGYEVNIPQEINELVQNITARKNVVLIVKEAINNIVKYSKASFVSIHIYTGEALLKIEVADNGVGFSAGMQPAGNGLRNMKKRAEELGGTFTLKTDPENGTRIYVTVPVTNIHDKEV